MRKIIPTSSLSLSLSPNFQLDHSAREGISTIRSSLTAVLHIMNTR